TSPFYLRRASWQTVRGANSPLDGARYSLPTVLIPPPNSPRAPSSPIALVIQSPHPRSHSVGRAEVSVSLLQKPLARARQTPRPTHWHRLLLERQGLAGSRRKYVPRMAGEPSFRVGNAFLQKLVRKNLRFAM